MVVPNKRFSRIRIIPPTTFPPRGTSSPLSPKHLVHAESRSTAIRIAHIRLHFDTELPAVQVPSVFQVPILSIPVFMKSKKVGAPRAFSRGTARFQKRVSPWRWSFRENRGLHM